MCSAALFHVYVHDWIGYQHITTPCHLLDIQYILSYMADKLNENESLFKVFPCFFFAAFTDQHVCPGTGLFQDRSA